MGRVEKTIFISYRRTDVYTALAVYENLKNQGYDVFFDYRSISSGDFNQIITSNIRARAHFLLILTPTALDRCDEPGDWLRREIELAIDEKRNIVPLFFKGFRFDTPSVYEKLTGQLQNLCRYNGLNVHEDYFDEAMQRLCIQYLNIQLNTVLHPVSNDVQKLVKEEQVAADKALAGIEDVKELAKQSREDLDQPTKEPMSEPVHKRSSRADDGPLAGNEFPISRFHFKFRVIGGIAGGLLVIALIIWGTSKLMLNPSIVPVPADTSTPSQLPTISTTATHLIQPTVTSIFSPSETATPLAVVLGIGSMKTGKDGMTLFYVPAGEFTMGSNGGDLNEKPIHTVYLDAFWIDQTEVTNAMYAKCVNAGKCNAPVDTRSSARDSYYGNIEFNNYPVIYVSWNDANDYCKWVDRSLPTEAQWEKAARGENGLVYPWGNEFDGTRTNFCDRNCPLGEANQSFDDGFSDTSAVGNYKNGASPYHALDMSGNVWEWVADWYSAAFYSNSPDSNPKGANSGYTRVIRGGSWSNYAYLLRSTYRKGNDPLRSGPKIGFRCLLETD